MNRNNKYGQVLISSKSQNQQFIQNGVETENIRVEVESVANEMKNQPIVQQLIQEELQTNDILIMTKIDWCSQNNLKFLKLR